MEVFDINPIKKYRIKNSNVTQQQIADKTGFSRAYIGFLENENRGVSMKRKTAKRLAEAIGCDWKDFYEDDAEEPDK